MYSFHSFISFMYSFYSSMCCYCYMVAVIVGGALALCGCTMQSLLKNPIVDSGIIQIILLWIYPYVMGIIPLCGNP